MLDSPTVSDSTIKLGRNDLCTCGSGKKYKRCCGDIDESHEGVASRFFGIAAVLAGGMLVVALALGVKALIFESDQPAGRVWSAEHGHYHNVDGGEVASSEGGPGRVWNEEHGHYHDAAAPPPITPGDKPTQGALEGLREAELQAAGDKIASPQ